VSRTGVARHLVVAGAAPGAIELTLRPEGVEATWRFALDAEHREWRSTDTELFKALRAAVVGLYADAGTTIVG
jgi:hypothetical protein